MDTLESLATPGETDFASRVVRARAYFRSMLPDVMAELRSQLDAEHSAISKVASAGYDYESCRIAIWGATRRLRP